MRPTRATEPGSHAGRGGFEEDHQQREGHHEKQDVEAIVGAAPPPLWVVVRAIVRHARGGTAQPAPPPEPTPPGSGQHVTGQPIEWLFCAVATSQRNSSEAGSR